MKTKQYELIITDLAEALAYDFHPQGCTCTPSHTPCEYCRARESYEYTLSRTRRPREAWEELVTYQIF